MRLTMVALCVALALPALADNPVYQAGAHSYTNAGAKKFHRVMRTSQDGSVYNYVPPPKTVVIRPKPASSACSARLLGPAVSLLAYSESGYRNLPSRWLAYYSFDATEKRNKECRIDINQVIEAAARDHGIDPLILECIITQESGFDITAQSGAGAMGLMQLMPGTAACLGCKNAFDPVENVTAGARYFAEQYRAYGDLHKALAAYNAGPGNVDAYGGVPPFEETVNYVANISGRYESLKKRARG